MPNTSNRQPDPIEVRHLADCQETIPLLAEYFHREWSHFYPERTLSDVQQRLRERIRRDGMPLALAAFRGNELLGSVSLKEYDLDTHPEWSPWLASLYVLEPYRRQGIGGALVTALEEKAVAFGIPTLYLMTPASERFYTRLGWTTVERTSYHAYPVAVMKKILTVSSATVESSETDKMFSASLG